MKILPYVALLVLLAGCGEAPKEQRKQAAAPAPAAAQNGLAFADATDTGPTFTETPILHAQVVLDQLGFSPGVIDGKDGQSFKAALRGFQASQKLKKSGKLDEDTARALDRWRTVPTTRRVTIPAGFAKGPFVPDLPAAAEKQAALPALGYRNLMEALAERFHTTPDFIVALNSAATMVGAGRTIRVPNIPNADAAIDGPDERGWSDTLARLGVAASQPAAAKIMVDKSDSVLRAYDADGKLLAQFPATMGSRHDPLPIGRWKIQGVSRNPDFHYNPKLFWDVSNDKDAVLLKPGPNSPVGVVWIDLDKPHYGIHGTSEPQTIGRAESHGCVRLTNWDAARLAQMVKPGTIAVFQE